jgi:glycosyltransferase involved in cell wall biosynthesis
VPRPDVALISPFPVRGLIHAGSSGVASYSANLARALVAGGARVTVISPVEDGESSVSEWDGVRVERAYAPVRDGIAQACRRAIETGAPVVHIQHEHFLYGGPPSIAWFFRGLINIRAQGRAAVVTAHQVINPEWVDRSFVRMHLVRSPAMAARAALGTVQRALGSFATRVIVHENSFGQFVPRSVVIPHGIESCERLDPSAARLALGLGAGFFAMCFGFVAPYKGLEHALRAAEVVGPDVRLVVAGGEHPRFGEKDGYAMKLREYWGDRAIFAGYINESNVGSWFAATDVVLLPYPRPHASSGVLALALAHGTPFLVSPALAHCVEAPPQTVCPIEPQTLAARLRALAAYPSALATLSSACGSMARGRSWREVGIRHLQLYEEVQGESRVARRTTSLVKLRG